MNLILSIPGYLLAAIRAIVLFLLMIVFLGGYFITVPIRGNTPERAFRLRRRYIRIAQRVIGMRLEHHGHICKAPALYISNHRSLSDPLATCRFVDAYVIAKAEVGKVDAKFESSGYCCCGDLIDNSGCCANSAGV